MGVLDEPKGSTADPTQVGEVRLGAVPAFIGSVAILGLDGSTVSQVARSDYKFVPTVWGHVASGACLTHKCPMDMFNLSIVGGRMWHRELVLCTVREEPLSECSALEFTIIRAIDANFE